MTSSPGSRNKLLAAVVVLVAVAAGVVGGHLLWSATSSSKTTATANRRGPSGFPSGGFSEHCTSSGCSFSFNGGSFGNGNFGNGSFGNGNGNGSSGNGLFGPGNSSSSSNVASSITNKVDPGLVDINTDLGYSGDAAAGTGMVITSSGEVFTNNHVIVGATKISATDLGNGKTYTARVVGYDPAHDIAVLQLENASGLKTVTLGGDGSLKVKQSVATIGNAGGTGGTPSAATGQIAGLNQSITAGNDLNGSSEHLTGLIALNGDLQPGDSGGPLVNSTGEVVGMDTAASSTFEFESSSGAGFAIPITEVETIAADIENRTAAGTIHIGETPFLGVDVDGQSTATGATIEDVLSGTPAASTSLAPGDVITALDGTSVTTASTLTKLILEHQPGDHVHVTWRTQSGSQQTATVTLSSGPPQ
jgi:S1-C subfamily serine protease